MGGAPVRDGPPERALRFGAVAAAYERYRPGYPPEVADRVLEYAGRPLRTAIEIGAGTGKATRVLAARGVAVTATDPDAAMLAELARRLPGVPTAVATLETLQPGAPVDLIFAAASLHWTDPATRWDRIAGLLTQDGVFASFATQTELADPAVRAAAQAARSPWLPDDDIVPPDGTPWDAPMQWPGTELLRSARFTDVQQIRIPRRLAMPAADYVGLLSTVSAYLLLPEDDRRLVLEHVLAALPDPVEVDADVHLHLARRTR